MRNKNRKPEIVPNLMPGENNEFAAYRRAFYARYKKPLADESPELDRRAARSYLHWLKDSGKILPVDWRNPPTFKELMAKSKFKQ